ncbi:tail fiber domain-containing protein [Chryseobacterium sp. MYb264]|uniref:tail fiber domain-containing protein n=1 Tax=Chryseobacterium sp. MYb264 TaxID=2745153 RepID=UPI002E135268|nr:tail fiber domain-containing protein [Chryseobacterium sp. MYb264]
MKFKNVYSLAAFFLVSAGLSAQVGINTPNPQATLDIVGNGASTTTKDGVTSPRLTRQQLASKAAGTYVAAQTGTMVYVSDATTPTGTTPSLAQTAEIANIGYYFFNGTVWKSVAGNSVNIYNSDGSLTGNRLATLGANNLTFSSTTGTFSVQTNNNGFQRSAFTNTNTGASSRMDVSVGTGTGSVYLGVDNGSAIFGAGVKAYLDNRSNGRLAFGTQGNESMTIATTGNVGIGTNAPTERLHVIGNILASGTVTPSDIRIKKDIIDNSYGLNEIMKLRTINYKYKDERLSKDKKVGFVAQEIKAEMPELVSVANDEMKTLGVNYAEMTVVLTKAVQEQQKMIKDQQEMIKDQQQQINDLKSKVDNLSK